MTGMGLKLMFRAFTWTNGPPVFSSWREQNNELSWDCVGNEDFEARADSAQTYPSESIKDDTLGEVVDHFLRRRIKPWHGSQSNSQVLAECGDPRWLLAVFVSPLGAMCDICKWQEGTPQTNPQRVKASRIGSVGQTTAAGKPNCVEARVSCNSAEGMRFCANA